MQQTVQVPKTPAELTALRARRDELSSQLQALTDRRVALVNERANASSFSGNQSIVADLSTQIADVSARLKRIELEKLSMDDAINAALRQGVSGSRTIVEPTEPTVIEVPPMPMIEGFGSAPQLHYERLMIAEAVGFLLLGFVLWRWGIRRGRRQDSGAQGDSQLRQAVDAIAIEVERISENQRYVTKLLAEQNQASPISRPQSEAERVAREPR